MELIPYIYGDESSISFRFRIPRPAGLSQQKKAPFFNEASDYFDFEFLNNRFHGFHGFAQFFTNQFNFVVANLLVNLD